MSIPVSKGGAVFMFLLAIIFLIPTLIAIILGGGSNEALAIGGVFAIPGVYNLIQFFRMLYKLDEKEKVKQGLERFMQYEAQKQREEEKKYLRDYSITNTQLEKTIIEEKDKILLQQQNLRRK